MKKLLLIAVLILILILSTCFLGSKFQDYAPDDTVTEDDSHLI